MKNKDDAYLLLFVIAAQFVSMWLIYKFFVNFGG